MLKHALLHPDLLESIARSGHHGRILLADGNYPASTTLGPNAKLVSLNLSPGIVTVSQVLDAILATVPVEKAFVMDYERTGPYALAKDPPVWEEFRTIMRNHKLPCELQLVEKWQFYKEVSVPSHILTVQTADTQIFANLVLDIGVRMF